MEFFRYLCLCFGVIAVFVSFIFNLHMFQLNGYRADTQIAWIGKNSKKYSMNFIVLIVSALSLWFSDITLWVLLLLYVIAFLVLRPKKSKKPLVYTARVKRMVVTLLILTAIDVTFAIIIPTYAQLIVGLFFVLSPFVVLLANLINAPIEWAVRQHYINDAKRILKSHHSLNIIGITGSFGKTSMKYYLTTILNEKFNVLMTPESYNTPMGIVKTIRGDLRGTHEIFVCEMGAKWTGDIKEICDIVHPHHGIITSIGEQHLESFKSLENIVKTKLELAYALPKEGILLLNSDSETVAKNLPNRNYLLYGHDKSNGYAYQNITANRSGTSFDFITPDGKTATLTAKLLGAHNVMNLAGAAAMAYQLGMTLDEIKRGMKKITGVPHRLQLLEKNGITIIDDAYNSNPSGCKAALDALSLFADSLKILVTPGMVELGQLQDSLNTNFGRQAAEVCDYILLVGEKQAQPILKGIQEKGFPEDKVIVFDTIHQALEKVYAIQTEKQKVVLLENDLPDNY